MEIYLVGGAVRDELLDLPVNEKDWVVVGCSEDEMKRRGYRKVGNDFPVFLHPETSEEYALARTERKTSAGHTGFECDTENVSLEDDLLRRDLTINAIARDARGTLVDPWGGKSDIDGRVLRHVSPAFEEDPLRVLRVARFAARFRQLGFSVAEETLSLMRSMTDRGDLAELPAERITGELDKGLATHDPEVFFTLLDQLGAGARIWPEITPACIDRLSHLKTIVEDPALRLAGLLSPLAEDEIMAFSRRLRIANRPRELALIAHRHAEHWRSVETLKDDEIVDALYEMDSFRQAERFDNANRLISAIVTTHRDDANELQARWAALYRESLAVTANVVDPGLKGPDIGKALRHARIEHIARFR